MQQKLITTVAALFCFFAACAGNAEPSEGKKNEVSGVVLHAETRKPVREVTVTAYLQTSKEQVMTTDERGGFSFEALKPGTYRLVFEKSGYRKVTRDKVVVRVDEGFQLQIEMIETAEHPLLPSPFHF